MNKLSWSNNDVASLKNNILLQGCQNLKKSHRDLIREYFYQEVIPYLQPLLLIKGKVLPFLQDDGIYLAVKLRKKVSQNGTDNLVNRSTTYCFTNVSRNGAVGLEKRSCNRLSCAWFMY